MNLHPLSDRVVLRLAPGARPFLAAYTSNVPEASRSAFCDRRGRAVAVADQLLLDPDSALLVAAGCVEERLRQHLRAYLDLTGTRLERTALRVYFGPDADALGADDVQAIPHPAGVLLLADRPLGAGLSAEEFARLRLDRRMPLQGVDYDDPMLLELDDPTLVSFTKGCYLGQEIVARVHARGRPARRLAVLEARAGSAEASALTSAVPGPDGRVRGFGFVPTDTPDEESVRLERALRQAFVPSYLQVVDESAAHAGHREAGAGATHWRIVVVSKRFEGMSPLERHRAVYEAASMADGPAHAMAVRAWTPSEWERRPRP